MEPSPEADSASFLLHVAKDWACYEREDQDTRIIGSPPTLLARSRGPRGGAESLTPGSCSTRVAVCREWHARSGMARSCREWHDRAAFARSPTAPLRSPSHRQRRGRQTRFAPSASPGQLKSGVGVACGPSLERAF
eukprot:7206302-Prymnesium_polylepis.3